MKAISTVLVKNVEAKISNRGESYYNVDLVEDTGVPNPNGGNWTRVWEKTYLPHTEGMESPKMLEGCKCEVVLNFYPVTRTVGDKNYTDIKCNIIKFQ